MIRTTLILIGFTLVVGATGCGKEKAAALEEYKKIEEACKAKDKAKASELAVKARDANPAFKKAFDETFKDAGDPSKANVCGIYGVELEARLKN